MATPELPAETHETPLITPPSQPPPKPATSTPDSPEATGDDLALPFLLIDHASSLSPTTKPDFLYWLRMAVIYHGAFYVANVGDDVHAAAAKMAELGGKVFDVDEGEKKKCAAETNQRYLGYRSEGGREVFECAADGDAPTDTDSPVRRLYRGPAPYPSEMAVPGLKPAVEAFNAKMTQLANLYQLYILEAIGGPKDGFDAFMDEDVKKGGKVQFVKHGRNESDPKALSETSRREVWLSFTMFVNNTPCLEMQNEARQTIAVPPIPNAFLVQIGTAMEFATGSAVVSLPRRAVQPPPSAPPALSVRYIVEISPDIKYSDLLAGSKALENLLQEAKDAAAARHTRRKVNFTRVKRIVAGLGGFKSSMGQLAEAVKSATHHSTFKAETIGESALYHNIRTYPDAARGLYPELAEKVLQASS
ncbi:hypothetical protein HK104_009070 [Borealophlyctis nickersoniae]|nr:hypothetical protein HK104_009070 [Borealophlyctis nickersoniae]